MTPQTIAVLHVLVNNPDTPRYGLAIAREAGLKTGTLHPILARLEQAGWLNSHWEEPAEHEDQGRPRRRYYQLSGLGATAAPRAIAQAEAQARADNSPALPPLTQPGY